jgi:hypothetical protein
MDNDEEIIKMHERELEKLYRKRNEKNEKYPFLFFGNKINSLCIVANDKIEHNPPLTKVQSYFNRIVYEDNSHNLYFIDLDTSNRIVSIDVNRNTYKWNEEKACYVNTKQHSFVRWQSVGHY